MSAAVKTGLVLLKSTKSEIERLIVLLSSKRTPTLLYSKPIPVAVSDLLSTIGLPSASAP